MPTSPYRQYTRKPRASHLLIALMVAAGGLHAHTTTPAPLPAGEQMSDLGGGITWMDDVEFFLEILWEILHRWPPPKLDDPTATKLALFNEGYATVGITNELSKAQTEEYALIVMDFIDHLDLYPENFGQELYDESIDTLLSILDDLGVIGGAE